MFVKGGSLSHTHYAPDLILSVKIIVAKGAPKFFKDPDLPPRLTVLNIPYLHNFSRPIPRTKSVMIQLYNTALALSTNFLNSSVSPSSRTQPGPPRLAVLVYGVQLPVS
jgi:hypothetical protein